MRARIFEVPAPSPYFFFSYQFRMSMAGLLVFVLAGTGTVSAAQGALPGDLLYPVKVSINEKVEVALAPTPAAKVQVQVRLAERRVDEARELSVRGRLDKKTAETLTVDFDEHSAQAVALAEPDEQEVKDTSKSGRDSKASAPAQATMTLSVTATEAEVSATTSEQEKPAVKKSGKNRSEIRESLREKGEMLKEIKIRSLRVELQIED